MSGIVIDALAFNRAQYLAQRQAVIAENIANVDTPRVSCARSTLV